MTQAGSDVHFDNYLTLLKDYCPAVEGLAVFDGGLGFIWQDGAGRIDEKRLQPVVQELLGSDRDDRIIEFDGGGSIELAKLKNSHGETLLILCLSYDARADAPAAPVSRQNTFILLSELLLADYQQCVALASKEDELNFMTDELTRRYEELNLIYKAEDQAQNIYHGRELLRQLVTNTSRFLNVDVIYLYIGAKNISMHKFRSENPVFHADELFGFLRDSIQPMLNEDKTALVINHFEEAKQLGVGCALPFKIVASPVINIESEVIGLLAIASQNFAVDFSNSDRNLLDVMSKKASKIAQSHFDPLTGLENSNSFELILKDLLKQSGGLDVNHAIANVDIDRLVVVNDISGRAAGDLLIKKVAKTLAGMVRARDVVARLGSDKFGILLENCDLSTAKVVMKKLAYAVSSIDMEWQGESHEVSVSIGIAPVNGQTQSVSDLLSAAETARNVSKERGRNSIHLLDMEDSNLLQRKEQIRWVGRIQSALRDDRFMLYAQLIQPLKGDAGKPHYEILVRMRDDDGSAISPINFLPAAESFYLMSSIDYWVINQTFAEMAQLKLEMKQDCGVSINLSGQSINDPSAFAAYIENKLEQYQLDAGDICFEITESAAIANIDDAHEFIDQVHALGCEFSLDDFGTGLSSFAYLKNLQVDYLKIDGSFVRDILRDAVSESMVGAINQVGQAMRLKTVAEFVENDAIKQKLTNIGVDYGQGYAIDKPSLFREIHLGEGKSVSGLQ